jgi:hypothetical protein
MKFKLDYQIQYNCSVIKMQWLLKNMMLIKFKFNYQIQLKKS